MEKDREIDDLISQIKANCIISDARHWGNFSICGLLLRMRELYRNEKGLLPWQEIPMSDIGPWIAGREAVWQETEDEEYRDLTFGGAGYAPFDADRINRVLSPRGLVYGAGIGVYGKPSFFLGDLISYGVREGREVFVSGREYVRDLSAYPAMLRGRTIFGRRDSLAGILWERLAEARHKQFCGALAYAFSLLGVDPDERPSGAFQEKMLAIAEAEIETYVHHEIGEAVEGELLGDAWKTILAGVRGRRVEAFLRGIKDILADTSDQGMLRHIIFQQKAASLGFYRAFLGGFSLLVFPEIREIFDAFRAGGDWGKIEAARKMVYVRALAIAQRVLAVYREHGEQSEPVIEAELIGPLQASGR